MMKYLGITRGHQFRLKSFLPGNVVTKFQSDTAYAELFHTVIHNFFTVFFTRGVIIQISAFCWMVLCIAIAVYTLIFWHFPDFDFINIYGIQENYQRQMKDIIDEFGFDYVILYGVNGDFYNAYYWFFADGLSNAREQYENGCYQVYKVIRDESTNEFCWFEPVL